MWVSPWLSLVLSLGTVYPHIACCSYLLRAISQLCASVHDVFFPLHAVYLLPLSIFKFKSFNLVITSSRNFFPNSAFRWKLSVLYDLVFLGSLNSPESYLPLKLEQGHWEKDEKSWLSWLPHHSIQSSSPRTGSSFPSSLPGFRQTLLLHTFQMNKYYK